MKKMNNNGSNTIDLNGDVNVNGNLKLNGGSVNATNFVNTWNNTSTSATFSPYGDKELINVKVKDITVEISYKQKALYTYTSNNIQLGIVQSACSNTPIDRVWKEIYGLKDGRMTLLEVVNGRHVPAQYIPESYEFDDEK